MKTRFNEKQIYFTGLLSAMLLVIIVSFNQKGKDNRSDRADFPYRWHAPAIPQKMDFAGEAVPLERWEIREELDRQILYNYYWQNNILYIIKLSNRYFPIIEQRLKANGVPDDFKYLCVAESNLQNAISKVGAVGFWQFMKYTAPGYQLEVNDQVDQRYDVIRSTDAACKYLKLAYQKFGSWTAAAASYNCGQGGYNSRATFQKTTNYYDLLLPEETNRYIFRILTFKHLMENADELGYVLREEELYDLPATRSITVSTSIPNLAEFAIRQGTTFKMPKLLNPWLRANALTVKQGKSYQIMLPSEE